MKAYLSNFPSTSQPSLSSWTDRISKSALDVLRWIVASNRSCIIQDDQDTASSPASTSEQNNPLQNRVSGMDEYTQFRFAQGAPDKEQRFLKSVASSSESSQYPTLFTWHGSPLQNWHGILREGLHYKDVLHGRAFGDGVYLSPEFHTSMTYMRNSTFGVWAQSELQISNAISLNEVVNAPKRFVSTTPHLVVKQLDWIQTRYLFVSTKKNLPYYSPMNEKRLDSYYRQDPKYTALGPNGKPIQIPMTVFSRQRRLCLEASLPRPGSGIANIATKIKAVTKRPRTEEYSKKNGASGDGWISEETDTEDILILVRGDVKGKAPVRGPSAVPEAPKSDFVPGKLVGSTLPLLGPPSYATSGATKALQRDLRTALQIQEKTPLHELGWYIEPEFINTIYQWIVELHSFEPELPLAADLKKAGLTSIVLELRFPKDYPMSPPFVRVIRPRFLGFHQGGGGHVTAGGALCMELLTNSGWSAVSSIESVLLQVRLAMSSTDPWPARLQAGQSEKKGTVGSYGVREAVEAYIRACNIHGWEVPKDFALHMGGTWSN
ncbi:predicted protein [Uncinocarpus reesii 1704]|uniref:UBC core domain-containing protein n=1 Tax=Uncinocarpus reesii (strain UAMH 1704) TaxID=336963 RepID=C4JYQ7_UNCRE|nr:uncharacterized protein UREG_07308 [Uncinocarpus reesii 1704]EEP82443.1 predicted protein [Uncinocarpus reesii 1704]